MNTFLLREVEPLRSLRQGIADKFGYFWLPCPRCLLYFSGLELGRGNRSIPIPGKPGHFECCCKWCDP